MENDPPPRPRDPTFLMLRCVARRMRSAWTSTAIYVGLGIVAGVALTPRLLTDWRLLPFYRVGIDPALSTVTRCLPYLLLGLVALHVTRRRARPHLRLSNSQWEVLHALAGRRAMRNLPPVGELAALPGCARTAPFAGLRDLVWRLRNE